MDRQFLGRSIFAAALLFVATSCGEESEEERTSMSNISSVCVSGTLVGTPPRCVCNEGYVRQNGICVRAFAVGGSGGSGGIGGAGGGSGGGGSGGGSGGGGSGGGGSGGNIDCGDHGRFNGQNCDCDAGFTQTGTGNGLQCEEIPVCRGSDDSFEPNDQPSSGSPLPDSSGLLYACPADPDWYLFDVVPGDRVAVEIRFDGNAVDLDLMVFGPSSRDPLDFSLSEGGNTEAAGFIARVEGQAGILVLPYGIGEGAYELLVRVEPGEPPAACGAFGAPCRASADCCSGNCSFAHAHCH